MPQANRNAQKSTHATVFSTSRTSNARPYDGPAQVPASEVPPAKAKHVPHRKRCDNCPKFFTTKTDTQRFCSDRCRKEFHANGAAFGALRDKLPKFITKEVAKQNTEAAARIAQLEERVRVLEADAGIRPLRPAAN